MLITVSFCCNNERGDFTGKATRVAFEDYELEVEDTLWPTRGVKFQTRSFDDKQGSELRIGRDLWRRSYGGGYGGNIFWLSFRVAGADAIGMMNYLMGLKWWHAESGECYLFDQFNAKSPIIPGKFFESRQVKQRLE